MEGATPNKCRRATKAVLRAARRFWMLRTVRSRCWQSCPTWQQQGKDNANEHTHARDAPIVLDLNERQHGTASWRRGEPFFAALLCQVAFHSVQKRHLHRNATEQSEFRKRQTAPIAGAASTRSRNQQQHRTMSIKRACNHSQGRSRAATKMTTTTVNQSAR